CRGNPGAPLIPVDVRASLSLHQWPVSMMVPLNVSRSTIAVQSLRSVNLFVKPENDSLDAIAMKLFSSGSVRT
ncbi:hypothetical protein, partial [Aeromicrobium sp.]|uniref:hypothetical protein n=1 Tax=Aeromicrobium sp. TaxID=1871063 RepID=UPI0025B98168